MITRKLHNLFSERGGIQSFNAEVRRVSLCDSVLCLMLLCVLLFFHLPAFAAQPQRTPLTLELLQEQLKSPIFWEGNLTIDLRQIMIDLRPENSISRDNFYQFLRKELQKTGAKPLGLDLSYSLIQGDFIGSDLGLRTPLYAQAIARIFTTMEQYGTRTTRTSRFGVFKITIKRILFFEKLSLINL